ncbi:MAG: NAD-dependent DNA ligase LigA [Pseudomonadota bacterium]
MSKQDFNKLTEEELAKQIDFHNYRYFVLNDPQISDYDFDKLVEQLKSLNPLHPILDKIGAGIETIVSGFDVIQHKTQMLSLDKCYEDDDLIKWAKDIHSDFLVMPKIDGLAISLRYDKFGKLFIGATRGDGLKGENITKNVKQIQDIPNQVDLSKIDNFKISSRDIEIRGEAFMQLSTFEKYKDNFSNPRNLAAGAIKQKDETKTGEYGLSFYAYDILGFDFKDEKDKFSVLEKLGFPILLHKFYIKDNLNQAYAFFLSEKNKLDYEIDGLVYRVSKISEQIKLGNTAHHPRYAIAYKFEGETGVTVLKDIEWSVARTHVITPVALIEPIKLSGAMVSRASLHNIGIFKKLKLSKNCQISVVRRGGVIPHVEKVVNQGNENIDPPSKCPSCGSETYFSDDFLYCSNKTTCKQANISYLEYFIKALEIDGLGNKHIEQLYENSLVRKPADFFRLTKQDLMPLDRMGEKLASKIIQNISLKKEITLDSFLYSLGIKDLGKQIAKIIASFGDLEKIKNTSKEDLGLIHSIGENIAESIELGLKEKEEIINDLLNYIIIVENQSAAGKVDSIFYKKSVLFTGKMESLDRRAAQDIVKIFGGNISSTVTKDLDFLVVGNEVFENYKSGKLPTGKLKKATNYNKSGSQIYIISEGKFLEKTRD